MLDSNCVGMSPSDLAKHLRVGRDRIYAAIAAGELGPPHRVGNRSILTRTQIETWIEAHPVVTPVKVKEWKHGTHAR